MGRLLEISACPSLLFWALVLLFLVSRCTESRQINVNSEHNHHGLHIADHDQNGDPSTYKIDFKTLRRSWVFNLKDMKAGQRKAIYFPKKEDSVNGRFIPREKADSIPFSRKELPEILKLFDYAPGSPQAQVVESAIEVCNEPLAGEVFKACFTSFESMLESMFRVFNISDLSHYDHPTPLTTVVHGDHNEAFQNYTLLESPLEVRTPKMAGCHAIAYPFALFFCHVLPGISKVFKIPLLGDDGVRVDAIAACHLETSWWDSDNWTFLALGFKPGDPVCHLFPPYDNYAWIHTPATSSSAKASI